MQIEIKVEESHWQDRAPSVELTKVSNINKLFKIDQVEDPILTAYTEIMDIKILDKPMNELVQLNGALYLIRGKIVAGYESTVVVDCGILLRVGIEDSEISSPVKLRFGDYVEIKTEILGYYHDLWEGLIHCEVRVKGKVKGVQRIRKSNDILLRLEITESGSGIVISPPYKKEFEPDPNWSYTFGKTNDKISSNEK